MEPRSCEICGVVFIPARPKRGQEIARACSRKECGATLGWRRRRRIPIIERFLDKILIGDDCWQWTGVLSHGYAIINDNRPPYRNLRAARVSYELFVGPIPPGLLLCHHCDNPLCVRPAHLFPGTQLDNMKDASKKGRLKINQGEKNWAAKLTAEKVLEIRKRRASGESEMNLAIAFGVNDSTISNIVTGRKWKTVPMVKSFFAGKN